VRCNVSGESVNNANGIMGTKNAIRGAYFEARCLLSDNLGAKIAPKSKKDVKTNGAL